MSAAAAPVPKIAFLGGGNMAAALIGGLLKTGWPPARIIVAEPAAERAGWLAGQFAIEVVARGALLPADTEVLLLAVKPQQLATALEGMALPAGTLVVSIVAGVRLATLRRLLGDQLTYVRTMPNTPALLGAGITGLFAPAGTPVPARALAERLLATAGGCVWLTAEEQLDVVTAVSGSGPAYFFLLVEALRDAGVALGLDATMATQLAAQTCVGAARMVGESGLDAATLRANVTSKGGTTEAALEVLETSGLREIFKRAVDTAATRARALGDTLDSH